MARSLKSMKSVPVSFEYLWQDRNLMIISQGAVLGVLYFLLYRTVLAELIWQWYSNPLYSYGLLVPFISCYLIRRKIKEVGTPPVISSASGHVLLLIALALYCLGKVVSDAFVMRVSMLLALLALVQILFGSHYLKMLAFPLLYLLFMIPIPALLTRWLTDSLMLFDVSQSAKALQVLGIPVFPESNFLNLPDIALKVEEGCSGASSIFAFSVLGLLYVYLLPIKPTLRVLLAASIIPLAVLANLFRIILTAVLTYHFGPVVLESIFHKFTGTVNFLLLFFLLIIAGEGLRRRFRAPEHRKHLDQSVFTSTRVRTSRWTSIVTAAVIMGMGIWLSWTLGNAWIDSTPIGLNGLPSIIGTYAVGRKPWSDPYRDPKAREALTRVYVTPAGIPIELFVGYRGRGAGGDRLQSPRLILPDDWNYVWEKSATIEIPRRKRLEVNWMLIQNRYLKRIVVYWYDSNGQTFSGELQYRLALLKARVLNRSSDMAVIRIATPVLSNEQVEEAQQRLKQFIIQLDSMLSNILRS